jgi:multidrug efflux pump subunit AcrA (membrane-fusion protein)
MKRLLFFAILVVLLAGGYYFRGYVFDTATETRSPRPPAAQQVVADVAIEMSAPVQVSAIGTVQSIATVVIKSRIDGQIANVHFEEGQEVKEGDLLFTLDNLAFEAQLAQAEATLERDRAQLERAQLELKRQTELANRAIATAQKLEEAQAAVKVFEAAIRADQATIKSAQVNLNYTIIRAPIGGMTGSINLKRGNLVNRTTLQRKQFRSSPSLSFDLSTLPSRFPNGTLPAFAPQRHQNSRSKSSRRSRASAKIQSRARLRSSKIRSTLRPVRFRSKRLLLTTTLVSGLANSSTSC